MRNFSKLFLILSIQILSIESSFSNTVTTHNRNDFLNEVEVQYKSLLDKVSYARLDLTTIEYSKEQRTERYYSGSNDIINYDCYVDATIDSIRFEDNDNFYEIVGRRNLKENSKSTKCTNVNLQNFLQITKYEKISILDINESLTSNFINAQQSLMSSALKSFNKEAVISTALNQISLKSREASVTYSINLTPTKLSQILNDNYEDLLSKEEFISILEEYVESNNVTTITRDKYSLGMQVLQSESTTATVIDRKIDFKEFIENINQQK